MANNSATLETQSQRPVTSKPRGICRYYKTDRGCYAGDRCKFLHGEFERMTPYDKNKVCTFHAAGYCKRADKCWFIHADPSKASESGSPTDSEDEVLCSICYDKPVTFGLLGSCSHIFCLSCIRNWRGSEGKSSDMIEAGTNKTCPMCRSSSRFVTPSTLFFPEGDTRKMEIIAQYKNSMSRVQCKYFEMSRSSSSTRYCPFGMDCFYKHENEDGTIHQFALGAGHHRDCFRDDDDDYRREMLSAFARWLSDMTFQEMYQSVAVASGAESLPFMHGSDDDTVVNAPVYFPMATNAHGISFAVEPYSPIALHTELVADNLTWEVEPDPNNLSLLSTRSPAAVNTSHLPTPTLDPTAPEFIPSCPNAMHSFPAGASTSSEQEAAPLNHTFPERGDFYSTHAQLPATLTSPNEPSASTSQAYVPNIHQSILRAEAPDDIEPPFMTDGRGRVIWSSTTLTGRDGRRARATSSSATVLPYPKVSLDSGMEEPSGEHHQLASRSSSLSRRLVRHRSLPLVGSSADEPRSLEIVTDGRGRVVFASRAGH